MLLSDSVVCVTTLPHNFVELELPRATLYAPPLDKETYQQVLDRVLEVIWTGDLPRSNESQLMHSLQAMKLGAKLLSSVYPVLNRIDSSYCRDVNEMVQMLSKAEKPLRFDRSKMGATDVTGDYYCFFVQRHPQLKRALKKLFKEFPELRVYYWFYY